MERELICPICKSDSILIYDNTNTQFLYNVRNGMTTFKCKCANCSNKFDYLTYFRFEVTEGFVW